jgi:hypothetical protein
VQLVPPARVNGRGPPGVAALLSAGRRAGTAPASRRAGPGGVGGSPTAPALDCKPGAPQEDPLAASPPALAASAPVGDGRCIEEDSAVSCE